MAVTEPFQPTRSEVDVAADTIVALMTANLLPWTPRGLTAACEATLVPVGAVKQAWQRRDQGWTPRPREATITDITERRPAKRHDNGRRDGSYGLAQHNQRRSEKKNPAPGLRVCSWPGALDHPVDAVLPVGEFAIADQATGKLRSKCRRCCARYLAARRIYLRPDERVVTLEVLEGDACVGHNCEVCHRPFKVGQLVTGSDLRHETCTA